MFTPPFRYGNKQQSCEKMEAQDSTSTNNDLSWSSTTNWIIADGSLVNSITFESSLSPVDETPSTSTPKSPLIMYPPSPDSAPCEIKICFTQKHEVLQVYIRSTARVYELYYEHKLNSTNEYLCTVKCSSVSLDDELPQETDKKEASSANLEISTECRGEEKLKCNMSSGEDDWVEVKILDNLQASKLNINAQLSTEDFYEATAQISDADPCISITLRLLSLQSKGFICVDEIYVFADPVDSESSNQVNQVESSTGSSLMAILVPTILHLSRTRDISQVQDKHTSVSDAREKSTLPEVGLNVIEPTNIEIKNHQNGQSTITNQHDDKLDVNDAVAGPGQLKIPPGLPTAASSREFCQCNHVERTLDQLLSRVSRIEDMFRGFEENLVKPISSTESRLQRVEQKLEVLSKNPRDSGVGYCKRIRAPEFSFTESDSNYYDNGKEDLNCGSVESYERNNHVETSILSAVMSDSGADDTQLFPSAGVTASDFSCGSEYLNSGGLESSKKDFPLGASFPSDDAGNFEDSTPRLLPSLIITAPDFSNEGDEEEYHASEPTIDSPKEKRKHALCIDDVLASALAGFLSSTSIQPVSDAPTPEMVARLSNEDTSEEKSASLSRVQCDATMDVLKHSAETNEAGSEKDSLPNASSTECGVNVTIYLDNDHPEKDTEQVDERCQYYNSGGTGDFQDACIGPITFPVKIDPEKTEISEATEGTDTGITNNMFHETIYIPNKLLEEQTYGSSDDTQEGDAEIDVFSFGTEVAEEGSHRDILQNVLKFARTSSTLNFEIPILDVKFTLQEESTPISFIEALLADRTDSLSVGCTDESDAAFPTGEQLLDLILVEDEEANGPASHNQLSVDMDYYAITDVPSDTASEEHQEKHPCCDQLMVPASLI